MDLDQKITELKKELSEAKKTRDRILKVGTSASFGGNTFSQVNLDTLLVYINRLQRELYKAEQLAAGSDADPDTRLSVVSQY